MAFYHVHFVDHADEIYATHYLSHDTDEEAIQAALNINVPSVGAGFEVWDDDRLVHRHRN
jgi:hypothetical protein